MFLDKRNFHNLNVLSMYALNKMHIIHAKLIYARSFARISLGMILPIYST
jgi:hypothetical protein